VPAHVQNLLFTDLISFNRQEHARSPNFSRPMVAICVPFRCQRSVSWGLTIVRSKWNAKARCGESRLHSFVRLSVEWERAPLNKVSYVTGERGVCNVKLDQPIAFDRAEAGIKIVDAVTWSSAVRYSSRCADCWMWAASTGHH